MHDDRRPFPDPDRPGVYRLPLPHGRLARFDAADAETYGSYLWCLTNRGRGGFGESVVRARVPSDPPEWPRHVQLARLIAGATDDEVVGFRDDDPLNLCRENLILCSRSERNMRMRKVRSRQPTSQFKGATYDPHDRRVTNRWRATITVDGRAINLGRFAHEEDAAAAYDDAAREHFGEHARPNFPETPTE